MSWQIYKVILQLCSPMHIGCGQVGNLQHTRPYIPGRVIWGALTMRITRDIAKSGVAADDSRIYREVGEQVHRDLAFTYFYPALQSENTYQVNWPWEEENLFRYRFLSSYTGTALDYPQQSVVRGMLREVEFISPYTLDKGKPVLLLGYIFEKKGCGLPWKKAVKQLQLGGERSYGWGNIKLEGDILPSKDNNLFDKKIEFQIRNGEPWVRLPAKERLLAHTVDNGLAVIGEIEPLVGREWRSGQESDRYAGQHVSFDEICFTPGSVLADTIDFLIGNFGVWKQGV